MELGNTSACTKIDEGEKEAGVEVIERVKKGLFPIWQLVLSKESSKESRLNWCWFEWYGENQHQRILQGYDRRVK